MDKFKIGDDNASDLVSTVLLPQKPDTSLTLQQAKQTTLEAKQLMLKRAVTSGSFVVSLNRSKKNIQSSMFTPSEIEDLCKKKRMISVRMIELLKQA
jgi:hypothetical protein